MKQSAYAPLAVAVSLLLTQQALAADTANLGTLQATIDRQGTKVKSNVVTFQDQQESTDNDLRGLLREEPAIAIGGGNGTSQFFYVRGMGQNSVDVKVDNAYSDSQIHYHQGRFMLDPALVKIVSVQKGAGAASAGIGATNGAIVAKTLDAQELLKDSTNDYGVRVNAGYASNDGYSYGASVFGKADNLDLLISGNRIHDNNYVGGSGYKNLRGDNVVTSSALDKQSYLVKGGVNFANHRLVASYLQETHEGDRPVREEFDFANVPLTATKLTPEQIALGYRLQKEGNETYVLDANGNKIANTARNAGSQKKMRKDITNLEYQGYNLGFADSATANIYLMHDKRWAANDSNNGYAGGSQLANPATKMGVTTLGANLNLDRALNDATLVKYGLNYRKQEVTPTQFFSQWTDRGSKTTYQNPTLNNQQKTDVGLYAEAITDWRDFTVTTGLRYDHFNFKAMDGKRVSGNDLNPSLGVIYQVMPTLSVNGNLSYASRSPRLYDAISAGGNRGVVSIADGTKAEKALNTEIGFNYKDGNWSANGSYYWQRTDNTLGGFADARHGKSTLINNAGHMTNQGYELGIAYTQNNLVVRAGVADSNPKFTGNTYLENGKLKNRLSQNPEFATKIGRTWTGSIAYRLSDPNLELGLRNRTVEAVDSVLLNGEAPQRKDGYSVSDVFANWKPFNNDQLNVNFGVNNVFDKNYRPHAQRPAVTTLVGAGRDYRIGINYTF